MARRDALKADIVTEDPLFLTRPVQFQFEWQRTDEPLVLPYACDPELAKQPLQFIPSKYQDPNFHRLAGAAEHAAVAMTASRVEVTTLLHRSIEALLLCVRSRSRSERATLTTHRRRFSTRSGPSRSAAPSCAGCSVIRTPCSRSKSRTTKGEKIVWAVQFAPATVLAKRGWTDQTFKPGDAVVATGHPSRAPGTYGLEQRGIERADGSSDRAP